MAEDCGGLDVHKEAIALLLGILRLPSARE